MDIFTVALTGTIGSGKTTASEYFKKLGAEIIDSDIIAAKLTRENTVIQEKIKHKFGNNIYNEGKLNRTELREIVFNNKTKRIWLEEILHPVIREEILAMQLQITAPYCIIVLPLLTNKLINKFNITCVCQVEANKNDAITRASMRDKCSKNTIEKIMQAAKEKKADFDNIHSYRLYNDNIDKLYLKIAAIHQELLIMAAVKKK